LFKEEHVTLDKLMGHGGFFKTKGVGQRIMAAAADVPVSVMETAGEGGAWGIAVLAAFLAKKKDGQSLGEFLNEEIFAGNKGVKMDPMAEDVEGFEKFMEKYMKNLPAEKAAVEAL
jgi:sugar (pentulose or hexulose) kinase